MALDRKEQPSEVGAVALDFDMAAIAQGHQIRECVGRDMVIKEGSPRNDVMDVQASRLTPAVLALVNISRKCGRALLAPVRTARLALRSFAVNVCRALPRICSQPIASAGARTKAMIALPFTSKPVLECQIASYADTGSIFLRAPWSFLGCLRHLLLAFVGPRLSFIRLSVWVGPVAGIRAVSAPTARFLTGPDMDSFSAPRARQCFTPHALWKRFALTFLPLRSVLTQPRAVTTRAIKAFLRAGGLIEVSAILAASLPASRSLAACLIAKDALPDPTELALKFTRAMLALYQRHIAIVSLSGGIYGT